MNPSRKLISLLFLVALFLSACHPHAKDTKKSVVKVFTTIQNVDFYEPWKPGSTANLEGCGTILPEGRILTNAHLANKATYIEVQKFGETKRYVAKVDKVGNNLDLALLTVDDKEFSKDTVPVEFGDLPAPGDKISLQGGDELSVKDDTVAGLDMAWVWEGATYEPVLMTGSDIDIKINGCPVFNKDKKFVGIPLSTWHKQEKSGSVLPITVVKNFLRAVEGGHDYIGEADPGIYTQELKSPALRDYYHLPADKTGVVVTRVQYGACTEGLLKEGDVLSAIDGHVIDNEGYTQLDKNQRVEADYLLSLYLPGETTTFELFRGGQSLKVKIPLKTVPRLVDYRADNRHPTYFMVAGFVFVPLTYNYLQGMDWKSLKPELKDLYNHGQITPERKEVVLLSHVLPHDINVGYHYFTNVVIDKVNGKKISGIKDLVAAFASPVDGRDVIEFEDHAWDGSMMVIDATKAKRATDEIMSAMSIPADRSDDLK